MLKVIALLAGIGYLVKRLIKHYVILSPENLEIISNFQGCGLTLAAYKKTKCTSWMKSLIFVETEFILIFVDSIVTWRTKARNRVN